MPALRASPHLASPKGMLLLVGVLGDTTRW